MGFLSNIFRGRDAPVTDRTAGSSFSFLMGGSTSGKRVNERSTMQMTAVYSCVRILSEAAVSLPLQFYRYNESGGKEDLTIKAGKLISMGSFAAEAPKLPLFFPGEMFIINLVVPVLQKAKWGMRRGQDKRENRQEYFPYGFKEPDKKFLRTGGCHRCLFFACFICMV
jgi:hypothetical protein